MRSEEEKTSIVKCLLAASLALFATGAAFAQDYPVRPLRLIVPWPPGGGADVIARAWATGKDIWLRSPARRGASDPLEVLAALP